MDILEGLFGSDQRRRHNGGEFLQNGDRHDDDHDDHDHHHHSYQSNANPPGPINPGAFPPGGICRICSTQTVQGARFCHSCGAAIENNPVCASCGSKLPASAQFCPQCGYKNG
jgi:hypothetical protein